VGPGGAYGHATRSVHIAYMNPAFSGCGGRNGAPCGSRELASLPVYSTSACGRLRARRARPAVPGRACCGLQIPVPDPRTVLGAVAQHLDHRARGQDTFPCDVEREGGQARWNACLGWTALRRTDRCRGGGRYGRLGGLYAERSKSFMLLGRQLRPGAGLPSQPSSEIIAVEEDGLRSKAAMVAASRGLDKCSRLPRRRPACRPPGPHRCPHCQLRQSACPRHYGRAPRASRS
jgi:hypothetical protein